MENLEQVIAYDKKSRQIFYVKDNELFIYDYDHPTESISLTCEHKVSKLAICRSLIVILDTDGTAWLLRNKITGAVKYRNKLLNTNIVDICADKRKIYLLEPNGNVHTLHNDGVTDKCAFVQKNHEIQLDSLRSSLMGVIPPIVDDTNIYHKIICDDEDLMIVDNEKLAHNIFNGKICDLANILKYFRDDTIDISCTLSNNWFEIRAYSEEDILRNIIKFLCYVKHERGCDTIVHVYVLRCDGTMGAFTLFTFNSPDLVFTEIKDVKNVVDFIVSNGRVICIDLDNKIDIICPDDNNKVLHTDISIEPYSKLKNARKF